MSTISTLKNGRSLVAVKGAPETIKGMLKVVPEDYDETYKWFTRKGSRVLALGMREVEGWTTERVSTKSFIFFEDEAKLNETLPDQQNSS